MPTREQVERAMQEMERIRPRYAGRMVIDLVVPDYYARRPKACIGGWGRRSLNVTPSGRVLPCHAAETIPGLQFWSVRDRPLARDLGELSGVPGISRHRLDGGTVPVLRAARNRLGGCRCQALAIVGDAAATDPACELSPHHARMQALAEQASSGADEPVRVSWASRRATGYCHSSSLNAAVALRAL